jgi:MFS family permease
MRIDRSAWTTLALLTLCQAVSMVDRQILAILAPRIKADLQISDAQIGFLFGTVFAVFYALFSVPLGRLADGWNRTRLLSISLAGWSVMTMLCGAAQNFAALAVARMGVGIGEAGGQPATFSLISDLFPKGRRAFATSLTAVGISLGIGASLWLGGAVADWWDSGFGSEPPLGLKGWQAAFVVAGVPGLLLAAIFLGRREPQRRADDGAILPPDPHPVRASLSLLMAIVPGTAWIAMARRRAPLGMWFKNILGLAVIVVGAWALTSWTDSLQARPPAPLMFGSFAVTASAQQWAIVGLGLYALLCWVQALRLSDAEAHIGIFGNASVILALTITSLQFFINYGMMTWTPTFIFGRFNQSLAEIGLTFGTVVATTGVMGPLLSGWLADKLERHRPGDGLLVTIGALIASPLLALAVYRAETISAFYLLFMAFSLALTMWAPPMYAAMLGLVAPRLRASLMSGYILTLTIFGLALGPFAVGLMSDISGNLGQSILNLFWISPLVVIFVVVLKVRLARAAVSLP